MYNYDVLLKKYKELQRKNKQKYILTLKYEKEMEILKEEIMLLKRKIKRRNKKIREKNLIIGWLLDRGDKDV